MANIAPAHPAAQVEGASLHLIRRRKKRPSNYRFNGAHLSLSFEFADFILDTELLTLQIVDRRLIGERAMGFLIDGAFERCMLFFERLDAI
jgi:hypothetical protein